MNFMKVRNVKEPTRGTQKSAGLDFYVPEFDDEFIEDFESKNQTSLSFINMGEIVIQPFGRALIPSGIKMKVPDGFALVAFNKSGISSKTGLDILASVVDSDYTGEIHLSVSNHTSSTIRIVHGLKLIQFLLLPVMLEDVEEVFDESILFSTKTERGEGGFGSTGE